MKRKLIIIIIFILIVAVVYLLMNKPKPLNELWDEYTLVKNDKNNSKALDILNEILDQNPTNSIALNNLAIYEIRLKHWDNAIAYLNLAREYAKKYNIKEIVTVIALMNKDGQLKTFQFIYPGKNDNTLKAINYNIYNLSRY